MLVRKDALYIQCQYNVNMNVIASVGRWLPWWVNRTIIGIDYPLIEYVIVTPVIRTLTHSFIFTLYAV